MATLFQTLFRRRQDEVSRTTYDLSWYINQLNSPYGLLGGYGSSSRTRDGKPTEDIQNSFTGYVNGAYKSNGPIFAIILSRLLLFSEARFQWRRLKGDNGRPGDLFGTTALSVLEKPWPNGTTGELLARMEQDVSLGGNFYCVNEGSRLRRLRPDWVSIVLTAPPEEAVDADVAGYMYTPGGLGRGESEVYLPDQVCHWSPIPDPDALYRGMSWVTPVVREVQADDAATRHKGAFFANGAKPGLVVSFKESVTTDQFKAFMAAMNESHQGADQAYKTLYVGGGADVTVAGANLSQLDFKATQGAGETRLCAAGGVPPIIVGLSEGLSSATYSNYSMARRKFGDHWARPQWRSACAALSSIVEVPNMAELWYDDRDIAFLREDQKDAAEIQQVKASTINAFITAGFTPESAVAAVDADDRSLLVHSGLVSVQLQPPGQGVPTDTAAGEVPGETPPEGAPDGEIPPRGDAAARAYNPLQPRAGDGKWTDGAGLGGSLAEVGRALFSDVESANSVDQVIAGFRRHKAANPEVSTEDLIHAADEAIAAKYPTDKHPNVKDFYSKLLAGREADIDKPTKEKAGKSKTVKPKKAPPASDYPSVTAKQAQQMQDEMPPPWTGDQRKALRYYTGNSAVANGLLRGWIQPPGKNATERAKIEAAQRNIEHATAAMRPSTQAITVRRTAGPEQFGVATAKELHNLVGHTMVERGFLSTTTAKNAGIGGKVKMEIEVPEGTPMAFVKSVSKYAYEDEVLLPPGMKLTVVSVTGSAGRPTVRLRVEAA